MNSRPTIARRDAATLAVAALAYFVAHQVAFFYPDAEKIIMLVWPAGGVGLAAFLLNPRRLWPALTAVFFLAGVSADVWLAHRSLATSVGYMAANMVESIGCAWLILRVAKGFRDFEQTAEVLALIAGAVFVNAASTSLAAATTVFTRGAPFLDAWRSWYVSDGLGVLVLGPFFVVWIGAGAWLRALKPRAWVEGLVFLVVWLAAIAVIFGYADRLTPIHVHPYVLIGLLAWPALRLGQPGVTLALVLLFAVAVVSPRIINGPSLWDAGGDDVTNRLLELQLFVAFVASTGMILAATFADRRRAEAALRESEGRVRLSAEAANVGLFDWDLKTNQVFYSPEWKRQIGYRDDEISNRFEEWNDRVHPDDLEPTLQRVRAFIDNPRGRHEADFRFRHRDGSYRWILTQASVLRDADGRPTRMLGCHVDITDRKLAQDKLAESERKYRELFEGMNAGFVLFGVIQDERGRPIDLVIEAANERFASTTGVSVADVVGQRLTHALPGIEKDPADWIGTYGKVAVTGEPRQFEERSDLLGASFSIAAYQAGPGRCAVTFVDVTGQRKSEEEREKLQSQLIQAQKMESVGRLAGGVAHDFNNLLQVILLNVSLASAKLPPGSEVAEHLGDIEKSAQRSADLTRQLLAFARKQTIAPRALDLNQVIEGTLKMLRRLIGEHISLAWLPGAALGQVNMDPSQVDQILANLCVNARDAIGNGVGKVTIETANVAFDGAYVADHPGTMVGEYVRLAVSDNGCGMTPDVRAHLFEPFFTTKGLGQGTGLGLATVYGIVKQNNGLISVSSEPGQGSTFEIYLPRHAGATESAAEAIPVPAPSRGTETILLVEDETSLLRANRQLLASLGYVVLAAETPTRAIQLAQEYRGHIDLLVTDVVMPEMNGRELASQLQARHPHMRCLFTSGYTADVIAHHGVLDPGVHFIQKPFSINELASKVRETLRAS